LQPSASAEPIHNVVFATLVRLKVWEGVMKRTGAADINCRVVFKANVGVRVIYNNSTIAIWKAVGTHSLGNRRAPSGEDHRGDHGSCFWR